MDLDWLDDFLVLAATQSFSKAAIARNVTQPAFSRRIQMLEKWVGTQLFRRLPRRILLTEAGERFQAAIETVPLTIRHARSEALEADGRSKRALSIAATHALSFTFFPQWARMHLDAASLGALNLLSDNMFTCEEMMLRGDASFLLCHRHSADATRLPPRQFKYAVVGEDLLVPLTATKEDGNPLWKLSGEPTPYLAYASQSGLGRIIHANWERVGSPNLQEAMTARLAAALLGLAEEGRGVAWLPQSLAWDSLQRGRLVRASEDKAAVIPLDIVLYRPVARLGETAEAFWKAVAKTSRT
jgi:DNA-binding transcriptional LysR family regulator